MTLSKKNCLDKDISLRLTPKIRASQIHERHDVASFSPKSEEDGKNKKGRENRKYERGHQRNKVDPVVEKSSDFEVSNNYYTIY